MRTLGFVLLVALAAGCGDDPLQPERSLSIELRAAGLPDGASAEYRIFVEDSVAIAHGLVANGETDTVRVGSSDAVKVRWQDARATVDQADYIFAPAEPETVIDQSDRDTSVALLGSYSLMSGGFVLTTTGIPVQSLAFWRAWSGDAVVADGLLAPGAVLRRGDLPPGTDRLQLDTVLIVADGMHHAYASPQHEIPLSVIASLDLMEIDAPYALASVVLRMMPSGLPAAAVAPWALYVAGGGYSIGGGAETATAPLFELIPAGEYTLEWGEVTVDGLTYLPDPASLPVTLDPRIEPYEFAVAYHSAP
jgi:hypothetical protein